MKIAYITCVYPPYPGGMGYQAQGMAEEMAKRGHEVHVYTPRSGGVKSEIRNPKSETKVELHYVRPWLRFGNAAFLPQLLWQLRGFDVIHLCYPFFGVAELLPLLRLTTRAKIVVHHLMDAVAPGWLGIFFRFHARYLAPYIFRASDKVLVLSEDYARHCDVAQYGVSWEVVPNGVDTAVFLPKLRTTHYLLPTILFVGGLDRAHYFKGVDVLIEALRILKSRGVSYACQIVGGGEMRKKYEAHAALAGVFSARGGSASGGKDLNIEISQVIRFVGLVSHDRLPAYYQEATVVVVPATTRVECFSIVAAEAQACGTPAIVSDFPGVRVTIEDKKTGLLVYPGDSEDLAEKISMLIKNPVQAREMGQAGRTRAEQCFSWKVVGDNLEKAYASLHHS